MFVQSEQFIAEHGGRVGDLSIYGQEAYQAAMTESPDLVILDVKMPALDGFEVLDRLRRDPKFGGTPIIMLRNNFV